MSVYLIEEVYELVEAIESETADDICEELGDVLFHIFFLAALYKEKSLFDMEAIFRTIIEKMIRRHPHVFGEHRIDNADDVKKQWHKIKLKEKGDSTETSLLDSVPESLPALMRAYRVSERAAKAGFDWDDISGVMKKLDEELSEMGAEVAQGDKERIEMEFGDVLFTMVNIARFLGVHPETALNGSTRRFKHRFQHMEKVVEKSGKSLASVSQEEKDLIWEKSKSGG